MLDAENHFERLIALLGGEQKLALAVSGGSDSMGLMCLAANWAKKHEKLDSICVLTIDHGLRAGSDKDAKKVCNWATELGLQCHILDWQHEHLTTGIQEKARAGRYQLMADWCFEHGFDGVITAHQANDQAETMVMRLARGSGVDGLSVMSECSEIFGLKVFRPLLDVHRDQLRQVLETSGQEWLEDPANQDDKFERVRVRGSMAVIEGAGISQGALTRTAKRLRRARSALETMTDKFIAHAVSVFPTGHCEIERAAFETLPDELRLRCLGRLVMWAGGAKTATRLVKLERLLTVMGDRNSEKHTLSGARIAMRSKSIVIGREFGRIDPMVQKQVLAWDNRFTFTSPQNVQPYGLYIDQDHRDRPPELPYFVACSLPVFCQTPEQIIVPHLDLGSNYAGIDLWTSSAKNEMPWGMASSLKS